MPANEKEGAPINEGSMTVKDKDAMSDLSLQNEIEKGKPLTLNSILSLQAEILAQIENANGEIPEELEESLQLLDMQQKHKVDACVYVLEHFVARAEYLKKKEAEFRAARQVCENFHARLTERIKTVMCEKGLDIVAGHDYRFKVSERKEPKICINETSLPPMYFKQVVDSVPDKSKIKDDLDLGLHIPGAHYERVLVLNKYINTQHKVDSKGLKK